MEGADGELMEKGEMFGRKRGRYHKDGHSYHRGYSSYVNRVSRPVELLHLHGNHEDFARFVDQFVDGHPEMMNWESGVQYSLNKNKRWNINKCLKNTIECSVEDFKEYEGDVTIEIKSAVDLNSEVNCRSVFSNKHEVPVTHSKSKAHGRLKVDDDSSTGLYVGIYEKNSNMYKSAGFDDRYRDTRMKKPKIPFGMENEKKLEIIQFDKSEHEIENDLSSAFKFTKVPLEKFIIERKQKNPRRKVVKPSVISNEMDTKKRKLEYYWDYVTANGIAEDSPENQVNDNVREESFLQHLPELKTVSVKVNLENESSLSQKWDIFNGSTVPRRLKIENKHEKIMMIMEENYKVDSFFNISISYDDSDTCSEKTDLLEQILFENSAINLQTLCDLVQALSSAQKIRPPHDTGTALIMTVDSMHRSIFKCGKEEKENEENEEVADLLSDSVCGICFTESDLSCLQSCGHTFCSQCWRFYTATQIRAGSTSMTCPAYLCGSHLDLTTVAWHAGPEMFCQFKSFQVNAVVEQDSNYHWCPNRRCQRIVKIQKTGVHTVDCLCGTSWCLSCRESSHWPASCQDFLDYRSFNKEIEKYNLLENTVEGRPCPKCGIIWEKIYGCNHMSCGKCGTHFCWGCGGEHSSSSYCGGMKVPLESIRILPLPTEKFSLARIESFQQYNAFIKFRLIGNRQKEKIIHRFLAANKEEYFEMLKTGFEENEEYMRVKNLVNLSVATMKTSKLLMTNNFLSNNFSSKVKMNHLLRAKPFLMELRSLLKHQKVTKKTVEITLKELENNVGRLDNFNFRIARMSKCQ